MTIDLKLLSYSTFKSFLFGVGFTLGIVTTTVIAIEIQATFATGETLTADSLTILKTAIQGIPNWTKGSTGNDANFVDGNVGIGTQSPAYSLTVKGVTNISRDGMGSCCAPLDGLGTEDFTLAVSEATMNTGGTTVNTNRRATIQFHNASEAEGFIRLAQGLDSNPLAVNTQDISDRRFIFASYQTTMSAEFTGNLYVGGEAFATLFTTISTEKAKNNIKNKSYGLKDIMQLNTKSFSYKNDPTHKQHIGLIAEQVDKTIPEVVSHDSQGNPTGIDYGKLSVVLIGAIKELHSENIALKQKVGMN